MHPESLDSSEWRCRSPEWPDHSRLSGNRGNPGGIGPRTIADRRATQAGKTPPGQAAKISFRASPLTAPRIIRSTVGCSAAKPNRYRSQASPVCLPSEFSLWLHTIYPSTVPPRGSFAWPAVITAELFWGVSGHDLWSCRTKPRKEQGFSACKNKTSGAEAQTIADCCGTPEDVP